MRECDWNNRYLLWELAGVALSCSPKRNNDCWVLTDHQENFKHQQTTDRLGHIDHDEQTRSVVCESLPACFILLFGQTALANRQTQTKLSRALTKGGGEELWMGLILRERRENWSPLTVREPQVALVSSGQPATDHPLPSQAHILCTGLTPLCLMNSFSVGEGLSLGEWTM